MCCKFFIKVLIEILNEYNLDFKRINIKITFLNGYLEETIYMEQPESFVEVKYKICLPMKSLYGSNESPRQWYLRFDEYLLKHGFVRGSYDNYVYILKMNEKINLYLLLYVDDNLMVSSIKEDIEKLKETLNGKFEMKDLGGVKMILEMDIIKNHKRNELFLSQCGYLKKAVEHFKMQNA